MVMRMGTVGTHVIAELYDCPSEMLRTVSTVKAILRRVVKESNFNSLGETFHQFKPHGVTGVIILSESHISVHTWPEKNFAAVDIFTCGNNDPEYAFKLLVKYIKAGNYNKKVIHR